MSSDEEDAPRMGMGMGGRRNREDSMLGVFGDGSDSEEDISKKGRGGKSGSKGGDSKAPLAARPSPPFSAPPFSAGPWPPSAHSCRAVITLVITR